MGREWSESYSPFCSAGFLVTLPSWILPVGFKQLKFTGLTNNREKKTRKVKSSPAKKRTVNLLLGVTVDSGMPNKLRNIGAL